MFAEYHYSQAPESPLAASHHGPRRQLRAQLRILYSKYVLEMTPILAVIDTYNIFAAG